KPAICTSWPSSSERMPVDGGCSDLMPATEPGTLELCPSPPGAEGASVICGASVPSGMRSDHCSVIGAAAETVGSASAAASTRPAKRMSDIAMPFPGWPLYTDDKPVAKREPIGARGRNDAGQKAGADDSTE